MNDPPRTVIVAGAGIGGLTAALALTRTGCNVTLLEQAPRLDTAGAGIQLSPNATRVLIALGLGDALAAVATTPDSVTIRDARSNSVLARVPLGAAVQARHGAPYWVLHRADLQAVLAEAAGRDPRIALHLGQRVTGMALETDGVSCRTDTAAFQGTALIGADGLWSEVRSLLHGRQPPRFARRVAWRATLDAAQVPAGLRGMEVALWLGRDAHVVAYPVRQGREVNVVAIRADVRAPEGWSSARTREQMQAAFVPVRAAGALRDLLDIPDAWQVWGLYDRPPLPVWGRDAATLLGDAAHPMLPFLAQGAGMAIEDAAVLATSLAGYRDPAAGLRAYERLRQRRTAAVQSAARRQGRIYHLGGPEALARNIVMRMLDGPRLLARQDWIYRWIE
ncbi:MAG TPA: FAD-dependent monooxygenase [Xanthobacteraceae bacterium]|nr:FAD-dependent monooxygenase [Xanthobacteraceae bacterium]